VTSALRAPPSPASPHPNPKPAPPRPHHALPSPPPSPGDLDDAVLDRMDEALEFGLPGKEQRASLLKLYLDK
jgi:hypothetical protein